MALPVDTANLLSGLVQDGDYIDVVCKARVNGVRLIGHVIGPLPGDETAYGIEDEEGFGWITTDMLDEFPPYPPPGDPGSQMFLRDGVGDEQHLEPVAKVMLQDVRVLRVVRPVERFAANRQPIAPPTVEGTPAAADEEVPDERDHHDRGLRAEDRGPGLDAGSESGGRS